MGDREAMAASLRNTIRDLNRAYDRARREGRHFDARMLSEMRATTEFALRVLTDTFWFVKRPKTRRTDLYRRALSPDQEAMLESALSMLTKKERQMLWLCVGYGVPVEAAQVAMGLSPDEAKAVCQSLVTKVKLLQRNVRGGRMQCLDAYRPLVVSQAAPR